jgi:NAD(P)H-nitrite reductase large subunit
MRYVIIGNSAAGISALEAIREVDQDGEITIISTEPYPAYGRVFITKVLFGNCELNDILIRPEGFCENLKCRVVLGETATAFDPMKRQVSLSSGRAISYDRLLLATGASAHIPGIPGIELDGVSGLRTIDDSRKILNWAKGARHAVIMGGGPVSLHSAEALLKHDLEVTVVVASDHVLSTLVPGEATAIIEKEMVARGVTFVFGQSVVEVQGNGRVRGVRLDDGRSIGCDMVVVGKGVTPNTELAQGSKIEVGVGLRVDSDQQTVESGVYAAGDVTESYDVVREGPRLNAMWPNAVFQGRVAGLNMAGRSVSNTGYVNVNTGAFFGLPIAVVGLSGQDEIPTEHVQLIGSKRYGRIIASKEVNGVRRLVGAVLIGDARGAGVLHTLIRGGINVAPRFDEFIRSNFSYGTLIGSVRRLF